MRFLRRQQRPRRVPAGLRIERHTHHAPTLRTRRRGPFAADLTLLRLEVDRDCSMTPPCARRRDGRP